MLIDGDEVYFQCKFAFSGLISNRAQLLYGKVSELNHNYSVKFTK